MQFSFRGNSILFLGISYMVAPNFHNRVLCNTHRILHFCRGWRLFHTLLLGRSWIGRNFITWMMENGVDSNHATEWDLFAQTPSNRLHLVILGCYRASTLICHRYTVVLLRSTRIHTVFDHSWLRSTYLSPPLSCDSRPRRPVITCGLRGRLSIPEPPSKRGWS